MPDTNKSDRSWELIFRNGAFSRIDESDDALFYSRDRFIPHLDKVALATVERLIGSLLPGGIPAILDLMASWDSHLPQGTTAREVVGLGLNERELAANDVLTDRVIHDLNADPQLPFEDARFDVVLCTVSVDYIVRPFEVFREVSRVLRPGGLLLVIFSNRMFPEKAVRVWREASEEERVFLVQDYFNESRAFESPELFSSKGLPRPSDDKYARVGLPSDPIYAVFARRHGASRRERAPRLSEVGGTPRAALEHGIEMVSKQLKCPHCAEPLKKWRVPITPFTEWSSEHQYICFNDECPYLIRGWEVMSSQGNLGVSYRLRYDPDSGTLGPIPVPNLKALRENIIDDE